jgi:type II secretory pathway pseudopilin PulG
MKKEGFTLIETMIVILIIITLGLISMPTIIQSVIKIEKDASIESAALNLRQFFIDARSKSILNETIYTVEIIDNKHMTFTPENINLDPIKFTAPSGIRSSVSLEQNPIQDATYSYILGMFTIFSATKNVHIPIDTYSITILINNLPEATVTVENGYPKFELIKGSGS